MEPVKADQPSSNEKEMAAMAEEEFARLNRQLRIMKEDHNSYMDDATKKIAFQKKLIKTLREEKSKLKEEWEVLTCEKNLRKNKFFASKIEDLLGEYERNKGAVREMKNEIRELNMHIRRIQNDLSEMRKERRVADQTYHHELFTGEKKIVTLENRLDISVKKFCKILTENKKLREDIDHLLIERNNFNATWLKMLKHINLSKKYLMDIIEQGTLAYDQREEWCHKLEALKLRAQKDFLAHTEEMREFKRDLDQSRKLKEFLSIKSQKRVMKDLEEKEKKKKESQNEAQARQLQLYKATFEKIKTFCEEDHVERIASMYVKEEEENFALFNYVNELNNEIETINESINEIYLKVDEHKASQLEKVKEKSSTLERLKKELEDWKQQVAIRESEVTEAENAIQSILGGVMEVFNLLKCDRGPILELLGPESSINLFNVMLYMGIIEKKVSEIAGAVYSDTENPSTGFKSIGALSSNALCTNCILKNHDLYEETSGGVLDKAKVADKLKQMTCDGAIFKMEHSCTDCWKSSNCK